MMIFGIIVATMIVMALVVFSVEAHLYKKYQEKRDKMCAAKRAAGTRHGAPMTS